MTRTPPPGPEPREGETLDQLFGDWWIYQLRDGHRFSTDDLVTAWRGTTHRPEARHLLDIGSGVGSVGLSALGMLGHDDATLVGVEAQRVSHELAVRSVVRNGLDHRVTMLHGDLRDPDVLPSDARFELITGSPPYFPLGTGAVSPHPQRAACRMELRGSVYAYCEAARRWLAPEGVFTYVMSARDPRTFDAPVRAGLAVIERFDVVFRRGDEPMISVLTCVLPEAWDGRESAREELVVRERDGAYSEAYRAVRAVSTGGR